MGVLSGMGGGGVTKVIRSAIENIKPPSIKTVSSTVLPPPPPGGYLAGLTQKETGKTGTVTDIATPPVLPPIPGLGSGGPTLGEVTTQPTGDVIPLEPAVGEVTTMPTGEVIPLEPAAPVEPVEPAAPVEPEAPVLTPEQYGPPTVEERITGILAADSPLMQYARTQGVQYGAQRGLLSSSIAGGAAQDAVIQAALQIATPDALFASGLISQQQLSDLRQQELGTAGDIESVRMAEEQGYNLETLATQAEIESGRMAEAQAYNLEEMAAEQGYTLEEMEVAAGINMNAEKMDAFLKIALSDMTPEERTNAWNYLKASWGTGEPAAPGVPGVPGEPAPEDLLFAGGYDITTATPEDYKTTRDEFENFSAFVVDSDGRENWKGEIPEKSEYVPFAKFMEYDITMKHVNDYYYHDWKIQILKDTFGSVENAIAAAKMWAGPNVTDDEIRELLKSTYTT